MLRAQAAHPGIRSWEVQLGSPCLVPACRTFALLVATFPTPCGDPARTPRVPGRVGSPSGLIGGPRTHPSHGQAPHLALRGGAELPEGSGAPSGGLGRHDLVEACRYLSLFRGMQLEKLAWA